MDVKVTNDEVGKRLQQAREAAGYATAADFARKYGFDEARYRSHESGRRTPKLTDLAEYAKKLNKDPEELILGRLHQEENALIYKGKNIVYAPLISHVQAGAFTYTEDSSLLEANENIPIQYQRNTVFALTVRGHSMNKIVPEGGIIVVDYDDKDLVDKRLYVFECEDEITFKRYRTENGVEFLEAVSTEDFSPIFPKNGLKVVGRVVFVVNRML